MLHHDLPIYRTGVRLLALAVRVQEQMPRSIKRILGEKITQHCVEMLDLMAFANATQKAVRAKHIESLLSRQRAVTVLLRVSHDSRYLSPKLRAESVELLGSIGKQAGGWLKTANKAPQRVDRGVDFVGHVIRPWRRTPRPNALPNALRRVREAADSDLFEAINSYFGLLRQSPASHHLRAELANAARRRGFCVNASFTQVFRKTAHA